MLNDAHGPRLRSSSAALGEVEAQRPGGSAAKRKGMSYEAPKPAWPQKYFPGATHRSFGYCFAREIPPDLRGWPYGAQTWQLPSVVPKTLMRSPYHQGCRSTGRSWDCMGRRVLQTSSPALR